MVVTVLLTKYFGALLTFSLYAIPTSIGLFIQWRRKHLMKLACAKLSVAHQGKGKYQSAKILSRPAFAAAQTEIYTYWVSIILLAIPGPITASAAFILMLPFVKRRMTLNTQHGYKKFAEHLKAEGW